jgi:hypothetical protein
VRHPDRDLTETGRANPCESPLTQTAASRSLRSSTLEIRVSPLKAPLRLGALKGHRVL